MEVMSFLKEEGSGLETCQHRGGICRTFQNCVDKGTAEGCEQEIRVALGKDGMVSGGKERGR